MEFLDDVLWWDTDGRNEKSRAGLDDNIGKLIELSLGVIVAVKLSVSIHIPICLSCEAQRTWSFLRFHRPGATTSQLRMVPSCQSNIP